MKFLAPLILALSLSFPAIAQERRISVTQVQHTLAANLGELVFQRALIWYEYRNTDLFGVKFPLGYDLDREAVVLGINPKAYFGYGSTQVFIGPRLLMLILDETIPAKDEFSQPRKTLMEAFLDIGINFTNYKHIPFHFSINCGVGGVSGDDPIELVFRPGISLGFNLF